MRRSGADAAAVVGLWVLETGRGGVPHVTEPGAPPLTLSLLGPLGAAGC